MAEDRIRVAARIRPLSAQEDERGDVPAICIQDAYTVIATPPAAAQQTGGPRRSTGGSGGSGASGPGGGVQETDDRGGGPFGFDDTFDSPPGVPDDMLQERVYEQIGRPVLHSALCGVSGCLFAYGQTGSGKTYALFGTDEAPGVLWRLAKELLEAKRAVEGQSVEEGQLASEEFSVKAAFLELYNENLVDLLSDSREPLRLFENSREGVVVPGLSESEVGSEEEFNALLEFALKSRSTGATCVNAHSSRSHALIQLKVQRTTRDSTTRAKIHLIDLAGSERQKRAKNEGARMREGIHINVSLSALGLVISRLSDIAQGRQHCSVPFRDSKLTFLLKDSLAGNSRTQVLVALSPASSSYEESLSTLRFAQSVKRIRTRVVADIVKAGSPRAVQALQAEVERLQAELDALRVAPPLPPPVGIGGGSGWPGGSASSTGPYYGGSAAEVGCPLEGRYLSPTKRLIEVGSDGFVRFLGGSGHHPIRILQGTAAVSSGASGNVVRLESEGDPGYRYVLVAEEADHLVWRHEDEAQDTAEVRWQRVASSGMSAEGRIAQALRALQQLSGESPTLQKICGAVPALVRSVKSNSAVEAIDTLVVLCMDIDEANTLLEKKTSAMSPSLLTSPPTPGRSARQSEGPFRLEATWLAPEPNPDVLPRELLQVKALRLFTSGAVGEGTCAASNMQRRTQLAEVWSVPEFGRRLSALRSHVGSAQAAQAAPAAAKALLEENGVCGGSSASSAPAALSLKQRYDRLCGYVGGGADGVVVDTPRAPGASAGQELTPPSGRGSPGVPSHFPFPTSGAAAVGDASVVSPVPLSGRRTTPGADTSLTPRRSVSPGGVPRPVPTQSPAPSPMPFRSLSSARSLPSGLGGISVAGGSSSSTAPAGGAAPGSIQREPGAWAAAAGNVSIDSLQGCYMSSSGEVIEVDSEGLVYYGRRMMQLARCRGQLVLRSPDDADDHRTYRLLTREPTGVLVWDHEDEDDEDGADENDVGPGSARNGSAWRRRSSSMDSQDGLIWTPMNIADGSQSPLNLADRRDVTNNQAVAAGVAGGSAAAISGPKPTTPVFGGGAVLSAKEAERFAAASRMGGGAAQRLSDLLSARGAPGESTTPRGRPPMPSASTSTTPSRNPAAGGSRGGGGGAGAATPGTPPLGPPASPPAGVGPTSPSPGSAVRGGSFSVAARGGGVPGVCGGGPVVGGYGSLQVPPASVWGGGGSSARPRSADVGPYGAAAAAASRSSRRSSTPCSAGDMGARRRSKSAAPARSRSSVPWSVRPRLGTSAGPGEPGVAAKAFDKNSLRLRNGSIFVNAIANWRVAHRRSTPQRPRRLLPGMCAVYVRKRPMFERDSKRCDFDVLTIVRCGTGADDSNSEAESDDGGSPSPIGQEIVHHACMFDRSLVTPFIGHTTFPFDGVFDADASNEDVYRIVGRPLLENALDGNLATLFVFGQTGSGKTYTMRAIERMIATELFQQLGEGAEVSLTYFELAGRKALDLLTEPKAEIRLREEEDGCFRPHDCAESGAKDAEELLSVMGEAYGRRATDATTVNSVSSRSHAVCRISVPRGRRAAQGGGGGTNCSGNSRPGCLLLVDCAGTERSRDTLYFKGQHQKESADINSSLFALKDCIRFRQAAIHRHGGLPQDGATLKLPSVRATPLTKVLAEALTSASAQLAAIATVSPNATDAEHTIDTLRTVYTLSGRGEARVNEVRQVLE